jgi:hypothetical protein
VHKVTLNLLILLGARGKENRNIYNSGNFQAVPTRPCGKDPPHHSQTAEETENLLRTA